TVASTAARASVLIADTCGAASPSDRGGGGEETMSVRPLNTWGAVGGEPASSAAQCRSAGSADDDTARIWPVSTRPAPRRPPSNGDGPRARTPPSFWSPDGPPRRANPLRLGSAGGAGVTGGGGTSDD